MPIEYRDKMHYCIDNSYLCNRACNVISFKCTKDTEKVTCQNCLGAIKKGKHNEEENN